MRGMTLEKIAEAVDGRLYMPQQDTESANGNTCVRADRDEATAVVIDSRQVVPGAIFVATKGERVDGHSFIGQVFENGALGVICEHLPENVSHPCIVVEDSLAALQKLAAYYRDVMSDVKIVGIVGSVGKTSTKEIVASVLSRKYNTFKTEGNFNNEIGVPLTILRLRDEHEVAVVEMGINKFGEMNRLGAIVRPDAVVMTNIGPCHLEFLGDLDGVLRAKSEVFGHIREGGLLALNSADIRLRDVPDNREKHNVRKDIRTAGYGENGDVTAREVRSLGLEGSKFVIGCRDENGGEDSFEATVFLPGVHMVQNALAATVIGREFGLSNDEIVGGIADAKPVGGRCNLIRTESCLIVDDCYNANPKSMMAAIDLMKDALGRRVAILGDMFELGADEAKLHAQVGEYASEHGIDLLICVGALSENMYRSATCPARYFPNREELLAGLESVGLATGDTILVKASHGMSFEKVVEKLKTLRF